MKRYVKYLSKVYIVNPDWAKSMGLPLKFVYVSRGTSNLQLIFASFAAFSPRLTAILDQ